MFKEEAVDFFPSVTELTDNSALLSKLKTLADQIKASSKAGLQSTSFEFSPSERIRARAFLKQKGYIVSLEEKENKVFFNIYW